MLTGQLKKFFGHDAFRAQQAPIIKSLLQGNNTVGIMPTGSGKSLCYQLPAAMQEGTAIVISPLIALMKNQVDTLKKKNIKAICLNSTLSKKATEEAKQVLAEGNIKLLYIAPETLNKEETIDFLRTINLSFIAIDEAHCISDWGHDFRPEYRKLKDSIHKLGSLPVIALTATATERVELDIIKNLDIKDAHVFKYSFNRPNLYYKVLPKRGTNKKIILLIKELTEKTGIIYCHNRKTVETLALFLQNNGINAVPYHAGLDSHTRLKNQENFIANRVDVMVATIAFGMGIDKPNVRFVIHYDAPKSIEGYYQETGRAGRDNQPAKCVFFYDEKDIIKLENFTNKKPVTERQNTQHLLQEVRNYVNLGPCRRKQILHYFGEDFQAPCNLCDNCEHPTPTFEAKPFLLALLKILAQPNNRIPLSQLEKTLAEYTDELRSQLADPNELPKEEGKITLFWRSIIKQALLEHFIHQDIIDTHYFFLSKKGEAFLNAPTTLFFSKDRDYDTIDEDADKNLPAKEDKKLLALLLALRQKEAKKKNIKPYLVFQENMLKGMSQYYPTSLEALTHLPGIGMSKAKKFGTPFLQVIEKYIKEHDIKPVETIFVKPNSGKFAKKIQLIQHIDKKISLEDLAKSRQIDLLSLIKDLEEICQAGVKINLDYYIDEILDEEQQEYLMDYFYDAPSDDIDKACHDLGDEFEEEDIRLMRIKFLCEAAN